MKIVFIASRDISEIGGIENYMANLCPILVSKGHEVILYVEGSNNYTYKGVDIIALKSVQNKFLNKILIGFKATINVVFKQKKIDIIHYNAMAVGLSSFLPIILGKKVIYQGHGIEWQRKKWSKISQKIIKLLEWFVIKINNNIIMVSQEQTQYIMQEYKKTATTIFTGANLPKTKITTNILKKYNLLPNKYILYLGRLVEEKRADLLISAYKKTNNITHKLVIAGSNTYSKYYTKYLHKLANKNENIIFTSSVYNKDKDMLLQNCFAFCIPSEIEGLPITLLEAMSFSKICIASNIPAHIEALGENGIYFKKNNDEDLSNTITELLENKLNQKQIEQSNYNRIKNKFTWDIIVQQYENYCYTLNTVDNKN